MESAACPSCGGAAAHPIAEYPAPTAAPVAEIASDAVAADSTTTDASRASGEVTVAAPSDAPSGPPTSAGVMAPPRPPRKRGGGRLLGVFAVVVVVALVLGFVGVLALKGVSHGGGTVSAKATPTATTPIPYSASQLLAKMQAFNYTDATFSIVTNFTEQGQSITAMGKGTITRNPNLLDIQFSVPITRDGATYEVQFEVITDGSTTYTYIARGNNAEARIAAMFGLPYDQWVESSSSTGAGLTPFDPGQFLTFGGGLSNPTLVGADTFDGDPVYHLTATDTVSKTGAVEAVDIYVLQDTFQPDKLTFTTTGASGGSITYHFTSFNTGISIALPSPDQVIKG